MTLWTVQCGCAAYYSNTVVVETDTLAQALEQAVQHANESAAWSPTDGFGPTFVDAVAEGEDADPWRDFVSVLTVPDRFTEQGESSLITLFIEGGAIQDILFEGRPCRLLILDRDVENVAPESIEHDAEGRRWAASRWGAWPTEPDAALSKPNPEIPFVGLPPQSGAGSAAG